jgi:hypothetical protein
MVAQSFNQIMKSERTRDFYRRAARTQDIDDNLIDEPDPRERPGDPGGDDRIGDDDPSSRAERVARALTRAGKFADEGTALNWLLDTQRGQFYLQRMSRHFDKRCIAKPVTMRKTEPKSAALVNTTSQDFVAAAKVHAVAKHPNVAPDIAFTKMITDPADEDGAAFRRVNARLRRGELYPGSTSPTPAYDALTAKAEALRKADPKLTKEQSFAKAYDGNPELREAERAERRRALGAE